MLLLWRCVLQIPNSKSHGAKSIQSLVMAGTTKPRIAEEYNPTVNALRIKQPDSLETNKLSMKGSLQHICEKTDALCAQLVGQMQVTSSFFLFYSSCYPAQCGI
eukprot:COSAG02_NODE_3075_length_7421_cov_1.971592_4_plen_104_part_00